ncbi:MAG: hypothetical protein E7425_00365 [Ruminococcaceae bacterium]|nr:hypothetical protein [Oscillospiraceae bacterium]
MTEIENGAAAPERETRGRPAGKRLVQPEKRGRGSGRATAAIVLSVLALLVAGAALALQLSGRTQTPPEKEPTAETPAEPEIPMVQFGSHYFPILENVPVNELDKDAFEKSGSGLIRYHDAPMGIDVSSHQGEIDWEQVAASGISFAMIRVGARGYTEGGIMADSRFEQNIDGALAAGLDVGIYFFSQATSVAEAEEEADYVLERLAGYQVTYPVAFDWESIPEAEARTDGVGAGMVTRCAITFCDKLAAAGYTPMVYFNADQGYLGYRLDELTDYPFWLAEYHDSPGFYYAVDFWQYTHRGNLPGIEGAVDFDLDLRAYRNGPAVPAGEAEP